jgi:uncharacterized protein YcbX
MSGTLTAIHIHPIKSCRAVPLDEVRITRRGLVGDRLLQIVDADGRPVTQRQQPRLATVQPSFVDGDLRVEAEGAAPIEIRIPSTNNTSVRSLLGRDVEAGDAGDQPASWFTELLGIPVRLVAATDESENRVRFPGAEMALNWADGASVLIANTASLRWLGERASEPFGMDRFRPNLTVDAEAWAEDTWRDVSIGAARFGAGLAWPRCAIPQVDQITGTRQKEPAKVLRAHRWCREVPTAPDWLRSVVEGNALFGLGCSVLDEDVVAVGDAITVHEVGERVIPVPTG